MILESLNALYDRLEGDEDYLIAPPGWSVQKVTFRVVLAPDGRLSGIEDVRREVSGRLRPRFLSVPGAAKSSGSGLNPCFLWDNSQYMLGFKVDDPKPDRTAEAHAAFRERHLATEAEIDATSYSAVCRFLEGWDPGEASKFPALEDATATGFGVFQILGEPHYVHSHPAVRAWWAMHMDEADDASVGQCLVTGTRGPLARLHPKIKGVAGAQSAGGTIVGFNEEAYESYGKSQSYNAPVSIDVATRYVKALNAMLDGPMREKHRLTLGSTTVAFWTDRPSAAEDIFLRFLSEGSDIATGEGSQDEGLRQKVAAFLEALRVGQEAFGALAPDHDKRFYVLGLGPNAARISVRFFHEGTIAELLSALRAHHADIRIVRSRTGPAGDPEFPPTWLLLRQTGRESKDIPPMLEGPLMRAILTGARYPDALFGAVMRRITADRRIDYVRASIIKGYLKRNLNEEASVSLDTNRLDPPYRLGRLFAALEKTQQDALGGNLNKTIRDAFYSSASATPGSVFPRLMRTYQHHLAKLEGGFRVNREKLVQEILDPLGSFPSHLNLPAQGLFAIGYYHQTRAFYMKKAPDPDATTTEERS